MHEGGRDSPLQDLPARHAVRLALRRWRWPAGNLVRSVIPVMVPSHRQHHAAFFRIKIESHLSWEWSQAYSVGTAPRVVLSAELQPVGKVDGVRPDASSLRASAASPPCSDSPLDDCLAPVGWAQDLALPAGGGSPSHGAQRPRMAQQVFSLGAAAGTQEPGCYPLDRTG